MENNKTFAFDVSEVNFHPVLKDIENMHWLFLLSVRTLSDYDVQNILRTKNNTQEGYLSFNHMLDKFNETTDLHVEKTGNITTSKLNILKEMVFMGKAMAILTYDFLSLSSYNTNINKDEEFQFLRHIRNGSAHNNKFKLQGSIVFNDFISLFSIFLLAKHFSEKLIAIDKKQK